MFFGINPHFCLYLTFLVLGLFAGSAGVLAGAKPDILSMETQKIHLSARPVPFRRGDAATKIFGKLVFRGGFVISSPSDYWGGLSGITLSTDGKQAALVSDAGFWARLDLSYQKNRLLGPKEALVGPIMALKNRPLKRSLDRDAEAITLLDSQKFFSECYISFEGNHRIGRFQIHPKKGIVGPRSYVKMSSVTGQLSGNAGLEALSVLRGGQLKGALVAIAQSRKDRGGNFIGWIYHRGKLRKIRFTPPPLDLFRITDAVSLKNGDLLLLERRYKFLKVDIRVRYVQQKELLGNKPIRGHILMEANSSQHRVDNMEGIAAHTNAAGETIITLISDDNFNSFQSTLMMQFLLPKNLRLAQRGSGEDTKKPGIARP